MTQLTSGITGCPPMATATGIGLFIDFIFLIHLADVLLHRKQTTERIAIVDH